MPNKNNRKGFTLIEVLVAVLIVGILASIAMPLYQKVVLKSRAAEAVNLLEMVKERQTAAISQNKTYIAKAADLQPLTTNSPEAPSGDDLYVNSNYKVVLNTQKECAVVSYIQNGQEQFSFASSYNRSGLGCDGEICSGFDGVTANVESVCTIPVQQTACTVTQCENRQFFSISDCGCKNCAPCPEGTVEYGSGCTIIHTIKLH